MTVARTLAGQHNPELDESSLRSYDADQGKLLRRQLLSDNVLGNSHRPRQGSAGPRWQYFRATRSCDV